MNIKKELNKILKVGKENITVSKSGLILVHFKGLYPIDKHFSFNFEDNDTGGLKLKSACFNGLDMQYGDTQTWYTYKGCVCAILSTYKKLCSLSQSQIIKMECLMNEYYYQT